MLLWEILRFRGFKLHLPLFSMPLYTCIQIKLLTKDIFSDLLLPEEHRKLKPVPSSTATYISPLLERTVIILPSSLLTQQEKKPATLGFIHVLDFLHRSKFEICGMKMILFSEDSVREIRIILSLDVKV